MRVERVHPVNALDLGLPKVHTLGTGRDTGVSVPTHSTTSGNVTDQVTLDESLGTT